MDLQLKICGMRHRDNIKEVLEFKPDFMGFIFYAKSPRFVGENWEGPGEHFPDTTKKVGVFVNEPLSSIKTIAKKFELDFLQLHGNESADYCRTLHQDEFDLIKVFHLPTDDFKMKLEDYKPWVSYFLFDTSTKYYGGSGKAFDWSLLDHYDNEVPAILSGGISVNNLVDIRNLTSLNLAAIDVNSQFEIQPGLKDPEMLKKLKNQMLAL